MRWIPALPEMIDWLLNCPYTGAWWENELKALGKWLELLLQLLLTGMGFCSACSSTNARLDAAAIFGEGLVLVTSGDISCFRQSGRDCRGSEVFTASVQGGQAGGWEHENNWWMWVEVKCNKKTQKKQKNEDWVASGHLCNSLKDIYESACWGIQLCAWLRSKGIITLRVLPVTMV